MSIRLIQSVDLNSALSSIDRDSDRRLMVIGGKIRRTASSQIRSGNEIDLSSPQEEFADLIERVMITSYLRAIDIFQPTYALSASEIDKALKKAPKHVRDALKEMYGSIARSVADKPMSVVRERMLRHANDVAKGKKGKGGDFRAAAKASGIEFEDTPVLRTVVRTQGAMAFNAATFNAGQDNKNVWGYQYVTQQDERVRKTHLEFEPRGIGVRYRYDDEFWERYAPPNGWNCRCGLRLIFRGDSDARKRPFPGTPDVPESFQFNPGMFFSLVQDTKKRQGKVKAES